MHLLCAWIRLAQRCCTEQRSLGLGSQALRGIPFLCFQTIKSYPVVVFMKGLPAAPMCGFSGAVVRLLMAYGEGIRVPSKELTSEALLGKDRSE